MEYLAVTTAYNELLSEPIYRTEVHKKGIWHRAVAVWILLGDLILLQQRGFSKDINPGKWDIGVAGHVDFGEDVIETCVRETLEELNLNIKEENLFFKKILKKEFVGIGFIDREFLYQYVCYLPKNFIKDIKINPTEVQSWKLLSRQEVVKEINSPIFINRAEQEINFVLKCLEQPNH